MLRQEKIFEENLAKLEDMLSKIEEEDLPLSFREIIKYIRDVQNISKISYRVLERVGNQLSVLLDENGELKPLCKYYLSNEIRQLEDELIEKTDELE